MVGSTLDQDAAFERIAEVMGCKWSLRILDLLDQGTNRPGAIERQLDGLTATVLHRCLNRMERDGLIERTVFDEVPQRVEYGFTDEGRAFRQLIEQARSLASHWKGTQAAHQSD